MSEYSELKRSNKNFNDENQTFFSSNRAGQHFQDKSKFANINIVLKKQQPQVFNIKALSSLAREQYDFQFYFSKLIQQYSPSYGIYILPSSEDFYGTYLLQFSVWNILYFIREGYYKGLNLILEVEIDKYKESAIQAVRVCNKCIYHPWINSNGQFDFNKINQKREQNNKYLRIDQFVNFLNEMFTTKAPFDLIQSSNKTDKYSLRQKKIIERIYSSIIIEDQHGEDLHELIFQKNFEQEINIESELVQMQNVEKMKNKLKDMIEKKSETEDSKTEDKVNAYYEFLMKEINFLE